MIAHGVPEQSEKKRRTLFSISVCFDPAKLVSIQPIVYNEYEPGH